MIACSALKSTYRALLVGQQNELEEKFADVSVRHPTVKDLSKQIHFILLHGDKDILLQRLSKRKGHFMPTTMLQVCYYVILLFAHVIFIFK